MPKRISCTVTVTRTDPWKPRESRTAEHAHWSTELHSVLPIPSFRDRSPLQRQRNTHSGHVTPTGFVLVVSLPSIFCFPFSPQLMSPFISARFPLKGVFPAYISYTLIPPDCLCCTTVLLPSPSLRDGLRSTGSRVLISCYSMWARNSIIPPFQIACFLALKERLHTQSASCKKRPLTHTHTPLLFTSMHTLSHANTQNWVGII